MWARVHHSRPIPDHLLQALKALADDFDDYDDDKDLDDHDGDDDVDDDYNDFLQAALKALDVAPGKIEPVPRISSVLMET